MFEAANAEPPRRHRTYPANFQNEDVRFRYTQRIDELTRIVMAIRSAPSPAETQFAKADELFAGLNDVGVRAARATGL